MFISKKRHLDALDKLSRLHAADLLEADRAEMEARLRAVDAEARATAAEAAMERLLADIAAGRVNARAVL